MFVEEIFDRCQITLFLVLFDDRLRNDRVVHLAIRVQDVLLRLEGDELLQGCRIQVPCGNQILPKVVQVDPEGFSAEYDLKVPDVPFLKVSCQCVVQLTCRGIEEAARDKIKEVNDFLTNEFERAINASS